MPAAARNVLGYLLRTNLRGDLELRRPNPDGPKIAAMMSRYFHGAATQQILLIVVMARFGAGI